MCSCSRLGGGARQSHGGLTHVACSRSRRSPLPPWRAQYILVTEEGKLHKKDNFEPMSFGMQRVHYESEPEPIWVQTKTARWIQSASEISVIPYTVRRPI